MVKALLISIKRSVAQHGPDSGPIRPERRFSLNLSICIVVVLRHYCHLLVGRGAGVNASDAPVANSDENRVR